MEDKEEWRPVVGYEGRYEVSSFGRVRSLDRIVEGRTKSGTPNRYKKKSKILKQIEKKRPHLKVSYFVVGLSNGPKTQKQLFVHRIVAESFLGQKPQGLDTDHIDNNPHNNRPENLRYVTRRENITSGKCGVLKKNRKCKSVGVSPTGKRFVSEGWVNGVKKIFGVYDTEIEASEAYKQGVGLA